MYVPFANLALFIYRMILKKVQSDGVSVYWGQKRYHHYPEKGLDENVTYVKRSLPAKKTIFIQSSIDSYSEGLIDEWSWKPSEKNFTYYSDEYKMIIRYHFA